MIRTVMTAHLCQQDVKDVTFLINNRSIGYLTSERKPNFVLSSNREVQMVCSFSNQSRHYDPRYNRDRIRLWDQAFREMQSHGIKSFPPFINDHRISAEFLYLLSEDVFLAWQDRSAALYLQRDGKLFRLQPTRMLPDIFPDGWMRHADFYMFAPRVNDLILRLPESFFTRFDIAQVEQLLSETLQLSVTVNDLIAQARAYNPQFDLTWLGMQIQRIDQNVVFQRKQQTDPTQSSDRARLMKNRDFSQLLDYSKVSRVKFGQKLIPAPQPQVSSNRRQEELHRSMQKRNGQNSVRRSQISASKEAENKRYRLGERQVNLRRRQNTKLQPLDQTRRRMRANHLQELENRRKPRERLIDQLQSFSFDPIIRKFKRTGKKLLNLWPGQPYLSKLFAVTLALLVIVILFFIGRTVFGRNKPATPQTTGTEKTTESTAQPTVAENAQVIPPPEANLEIEITIKANNLQIRQTPNQTAPLVSTLKRGDKVTQLSEPIDNWVYVRLSDGKTTGYAYADYLLNRTD